MTTRTRSRGTLQNPIQQSDQLVVTGVYPRPTDGGILTPGAYAPVGSFLGGSDNRSSIQDELGNKGGLNACRHMQYMLASIPDIRFEWRFRTVSGPSGSAVYSGVGSEALYRAQQWSMGHSTPGNGAAIAKSRCSVYGKPLISGLNSLFELKDFAPLLRSIVKGLNKAIIRRKLRELRPSAFNSWWTDYIRKSPREWLDHIVGLDLEWKFNWASFIGDIQKIHSLLGTVDTQLVKMGTTRIHAYGRYFASLDRQLVHYSNLSGGSLDHRVRSCTSFATTKSTYVYGAEVSLPRLATMRIDRLRLNAIREKLGLRLTPSVIWKAIPRSFIVDWFIPISDWLEQFNTAQIDRSDLVVHRRWTSEKLVTEGATVETISPRKYSTVGIESGNTVVCTVPWKQTSYIRSEASASDVPDLDLPRFRLPAMAFWFTGFELLISRGHSSTQQGGPSA